MKNTKSELEQKIQIKEEEMINLGDKKRSESKKQNKIQTKQPTTNQ